MARRESISRDEEGLDSQEDCNTATNRVNVVTSVTSRLNVINSETALSVKKSPASINGLMD